MTPLDRLLAIILVDDVAATRLVRADPSIAVACVAKERLVREVPRQLYAGDTALHFSAAALRPAVVAALLAAGADPNAQNRRGATALHYVCDRRASTCDRQEISSQLAVIERLVSAGADVERKDQAGATPLHKAVRRRTPDVVRTLLEYGASVHSMHGRLRTTALHIVTHSTGASSTKDTRVEQQEIVRLLLQYGADSRAKDANGHIPKL